MLILFLGVLLTKMYETEQQHGACDPSWQSAVQSTPHSHLISLRSILQSSEVVFCLLCPMRAACLAHPILLHLATVIFDVEHKSEFSIYFYLIWK
jgi:hypothetical protein